MLHIDRFTLYLHLIFQASAADVAVSHILVSSLGRLLVTGLSIINSHTQLRFKLLQTALHEHFLYYCLRLYLSRAVHHAACEHDTSRLPFLEVKLD